MQWLEVKIYTTRAGVEPLSAMLLDCGVTGMQVEDDEEFKEFAQTSSIYWDYIDEELLNKEVEDTRVLVYLSDNAYGAEMLMNIKDGLTRLKNEDLGFDLGRLEYEIVNKNDEDWLNKWKEFYKPFKVGNRFYIKPQWEEIKDDEGRIVFNINPGNVFGSGLHQTTQLCICELEKYVNENSVVADLGCGSGILAISALLLGAKSAFGVDIDFNAIKTAYENAEINGVYRDKLYVTSGNVINDEKLQAEIGFEKYDIVCANIVADVIIAIMPFAAKAIKKDGVFITSGIIRERLSDVQTAMNENGFEIISINEKDEWINITSKVRSE